MNMQLARGKQRFGLVKALFVYRQLSIIWCDLKLAHQTGGIQVYSFGNLFKA